MNAESFGDSAAELSAVDLEMGVEPCGDGAVDLNAVELDANTN